jgi:cytochrome c biogenesis protein CcmG, thiol:disulfide interchange protein DsbE
MPMPTEPRSARRPLAACIAILALSAVLPLAGCTPDLAVVGSAVPDYAASDRAGAHVSLHDLRGEVVLVNVWATWCAPCRHEMPGLEELQRQLAGEGLRVVAVSVDEASAGAEIDTFVRELGLSMTVLHDPAMRVARTFGTIGVPETFLVGRDGTLLQHWRGRIDARSPQVRVPVYRALDARLTHGG